MTIIRSLLLIMGLLFGLAIQAQQDTTQLKFSEELLKEPENKNMKWVRVKNRNYNMDDVPAMLKMGVVPIHTGSRNSIYGINSMTLNLGYQQKIKNTQFSVEGRFRSLFRFKDDGFSDASRRVFTSNERVVRLLRNYINLDVIVRYQPFKQNSILKQKSGDNLYGFYVFGRALNLLSWQKEKTTIYRLDTVNALLFRETEQLQLSSRAVLLVGGVGVQKRFLKKGYINLTLDIAHFNSKYYQRKSYLEFEIGYSLFKVKK